MDPDQLRFQDAALPFRFKRDTIARGHRQQHRMRRAPSTTCALVTTYPLGSTTTPDPIALWRAISAASVRPLSSTAPYPVTRICTTPCDTLSASALRAVFSWASVSEAFDATSALARLVPAACESAGPAVFEAFVSLPHSIRNCNKSKEYRQNCRPWAQPGRGLDRHQRSPWQAMESGASPGRKYSARKRLPPQSASKATSGGPVTG